MAKFKRCVNCIYYNMSRYSEEDNPCLKYDYDEVYEDKKGYEGCYRKCNQDKEYK